MKSAISLLLCLLALLPLTGCDDDANPTDAITLYDIVAFRGQTDGYARFTVQQTASSPVATYRAQGAIIDTDKVAPGQCLMIAYTAENGAYTSGNINVSGYRVTNNAALAQEAISADDLADLEAVYLLSAWRSEEFLNFHVKLPYDDKARLFTLVRDTNSPDPSCPDLYLLHRRQEIVDTFDRAYYISFDISSLLADPAVTGFTLHLDNANLLQDAISFAL